jgi:long-chain acyl-CoA synthetase
VNIANHVERIARTAPARKAIVLEGQDISYGALDACANALASTLKAKGVRRGDRVALYLPNIPAFMLAFLAGQ